jgi:hypothetical protein
MSLGFVDIPSGVHKGDKPPVVVTSNFGGAPSPRNKRFAYLAFSRSTGEADDELFGILDLLNVLGNEFRRDSKKRSKRGFMGQQPSLYFTNGDPEQQVGMAWHRQPLFDKSCRTRVTVQIR